MARFDLGDIHTPADVRKKWTRICRCGVGWLIAGILSLIIGIILMVFFVKFWNDTTNWQRGLGYAGVGILCFGVLVITIGIILSCTLCYIMRLAESKRYYTPKTYGLEVPYPRQPVAGVPAVPSAPQDPEKGQTNPAADIEMVHPEVKDKTF